MKSNTLFTAVLFKALSKSKSGSLEEPLIPPKKNEQEPQKKTTFSLLDDAHLLMRLKILFFVTGSLVALLSQFILYQMLWNEEILTKETTDVVVFSLMWSFWTCLIIFSAMVLLLLTVSSHNENEYDWDDIAFQLEAHHIVGALLSIAASWLVIDLLHGGGKHIHVAAATNTHYSTILFSVGVVAYMLFCRFMMRQSSNPTKATPNSMLPTYQLVAATLGLIMGISSQYILSFFLWNSDMTKPILDNSILFSLLWSLCTVFLTFLGCVTLRFLTKDEQDVVHAERIFLRMESHYIFTSLVGISLAWILMDVMLDSKQLILPSILMLAISLLAFQAILYCFPEEKCLEEMKLAAAQEEEKKKKQAVQVAIQIV